MKWLRRKRQQACSYVLFKTRDGESIQGVMVGRSLKLEQVVAQAKALGLEGIEVGTLDKLERCIPFDDIVEFTAAPYDGPPWWLDED